MPDKTSMIHRQEDNDFYENELASFVPDRIYDAHVHLWVNRYDGLPQSIPGPVGIQRYIKLMHGMFGSRRIGGLLIPFPSKDNRDEEDNWVAEQINAAGDIDSAYRSVMLVTPEDDPEFLREAVRQSGSIGLKCYHSFSGNEQSWQAKIPEYLPEQVMEIADELGLVIVLHMVRSRAVSDKENIYWIRRYCQSYRNARIILAHSARGFQPGHNLEGLPELIGLDNLFFDCSANCEPLAHQVIIRLFGHRKLLYGSDFPVSYLRGRSLAAGDSFVWLNESSPVWGEKHQRVKPVLVGLENLRSLKWACWSERLSDSQVEDIFWNNAAELFGFGN